MYLHLQRRLGEHMAEFLLRTYSLDRDIFFVNFTVEQPPRIELGDYAIPIAFGLAKKLRKSPLKIAQEIVDGIGRVESFEKLEVAGAGYINARVDRAEFAAALVTDILPKPKVPQPKLPSRSLGKVLVEHSSINPNKAAHIGHLRNAILGDTFVRLLRFAGREVDVQNYIDNTGAQVADVVVGFLHIEKKSRAQIEALAAGPRFDFVCWDLYARVSHWYEEDKANLQARNAVLRLIEEGNNETAAIADLISVAVLRRHLETMERLDVEYDFLPRESEILHLHFWDAAFTKLKEAGVLTFETSGKNKGCWVMRRAGTSAAETLTGGTEDTGDGEAEKITEEDQKVIVRSNGTVGYVGKDIAYHMWKFGLLGRDFGYRKFFRYPNAHNCWISTTDGEIEHPHFGDVAEIYNVIDARQSEAQNTVIEALRGLGHGEAAERYTHFSYEMVALTPRCAVELGYTLSEEDKARLWIEVSGRKGFGVKADDLLDALIASAGKEVDARHPELRVKRSAATLPGRSLLGSAVFHAEVHQNVGHRIRFQGGVEFRGRHGALRAVCGRASFQYFPEGRIWPGSFCRDAAGRVSLATGNGVADRDEASLVSTEDFATYLNGESGDEIWELWLAAAKTSYIVAQCIATTEPAYLAKHAFQLAQLFNAFYHRHPILSETDEGRKSFLLATTAVVRRELIRVLATMGITVPPVM